MRSLLLALVAGFAIAACGGNAASPVSPSAAPPSSSALTGTWSGTSADTTGPETITCTLTQNGTTLSGTMAFNDSQRNMMGNGVMQATVNGQTVTFHMGVPNGGFSGMMSSCIMSADGQATISADGHTMTGTYSGSMSGMMSGGMMGRSCGGTMGNGHFTLTR